MLSLNDSEQNLLNVAENLIPYYLYFYYTKLNLSTFLKSITLLIRCKTLKNGYFWKSAIVFSLEISQQKKKNICKKIYFLLYLESQTLMMVNCVIIKLLFN